MTSPTGRTIVDYRKIDAALATAIGETHAPDRAAFVVFVHTEHPPGPEEKDVLESHGVGVGTGSRNIFTATLSPRSIEELTEQPWVRSLRLSTRLRPLE
jgi:hypothetical protein